MLPYNISIYYFSYSNGFFFQTAENKIYVVRPPFQAKFILLKFTGEEEFLNFMIFSKK
jgi:hypothetical protein